MWSRNHSELNQRRILTQVTQENMFTEESRTVWWGAGSRTGLKYTGRQVAHIK